MGGGSFKIEDSKFPPSKTKVLKSQRSTDWIEISLEIDEIWVQSVERCDMQTLGKPTNLKPREVFALDLKGIYFAFNPSVEPPAAVGCLGCEPHVSEESER